MNVNIRIVFPMAKITQTSAFKMMNHLNLIFHKKELKGFYFEPRNFKINTLTESPLISYLREVLFTYDLFYPGNYCDIPVRILVFTKNNEEIPTHISGLPQWIFEEIKYVPMNSTMYDDQKLPSILISFIKSNVIPRFRDLCSFNDDPDICPPIKKAFLSMSQGDYVYALNQFQNISKTPYMDSVSLAIVSCNIITGNIDSSLLSRLSSLIDQSNPHDIRHLLFTVLHFWVQEKADSLNISYFSRLDFNLNSSGQNDINWAQPFIFEQMISFFKERYIPLALYNLSTNYEARGAMEHFARTLWNLWSIIKFSGWNECSLYPIRRLFELLVREPKFSKPEPGEKWFLADELALIMKQRTLPFAPIITTYFALTNPAPTECGFIHPVALSYRISNFNPEDFPDSPTLLSNICQKLTQSILSDQFVYKNHSNDFLTVFPGDQISVTIRIINTCTDFPVNSCSLRIDGPAISTQEDNIERVSKKKKEGVNEFKLIANVMKANNISYDQLQITGTNFVFCDHIHLYSFFKHPSLVFNFEPKSADIELIVNSPEKEILVGEALKLEALIKCSDGFEFTKISTYIYTQSKKSKYLRISNSDNGFNVHSFSQNLIYSATESGGQSVWVIFAFKTNDCNIVRFRFAKWFLNVVDMAEKEEEYISFLIAPTPMFPAFDDEQPFSVTASKKNEIFIITVKNLSLKSYRNCRAKIENDFLSGKVCAFSHSFKPKDCIQLSFRLLKEVHLEISSKQTEEFILTIDYERSSARTNLSTLLTVL